MFGGEGSFFAQEGERGKFVCKFMKIWTKVKGEGGWVLVQEKKG